VRKTIDGLIATICITNGHLLPHSDHDDDGFERHLGLQVVKAHPALPPARMKAALPALARLRTLLVDTERTPRSV
jgi:hypothetical protein